MILQTMEKVSKNYGGKALLDGITLTISEGDKIGVIGVNGTGKSTFLRLAAGVEDPDAGQINQISKIKVGYLPQNPVFMKHATVLEQALQSAGAEDGGSLEYECKAMLTRLGVPDFDTDVSLLSGGQKKRVAMAAALAGKTDLLILDEPTNHIDNETVLWLEEFLSKYHGALLMVTHDRYFLERVVNKIVELQNGNLYSYPANYSKYLELKAERENMQAAAERKRQALLKKELAWIQRGAKARSTKARFRVERFEDLKRQPGSPGQEKLEISAASSRLGKKIIEIDHISKAYNGVELFQDFSYNLLRVDRVGIIGPNGCGKSTLLKTILGRIVPDSGSVKIGETVKIGYFSQETEDMDPSLRVIDYIRDEAAEIETPDGTFSAAQMLERFLFPPELQYSLIGRLSGGERRRLYLLYILMQAPNILFLDEPTNDLDIQTLSILEDYLDTFPGAVVAVSHDRYFLDRIAEHLFVFEGNGEIIHFPGGYSDYWELKKEQALIAPQEKPSGKKAKPERQHKDKLKFSFREQREFEEIDGVIAALEEELSVLQEEIEQKASSYEELPSLIQKKENLEKTLSDKMDRWVYLNDLAEKIDRQAHNG